MLGVAEGSVWPAYYHGAVGLTWAIGDKKGRCEYLPPMEEKDRMVDFRDAILVREFQSTAGNAGLTPSPNRLQYGTLRTL